MYRSGRLPPERLESFIRSLGIETVVNLSGPNDSPWYAAEREVVADSSAHLIDLPFSARLYPAPSQLRELLDVVESIEPPFLVHCRGGSDRTGLFFVLLALRQGKSWSQAMGQLSLLRFTHCSRAKSAAITYPLYDFAQYAQANDLPPDLEHFRKWIGTDHAQRTYQSWLQRRTR